MQNKSIQKNDFTKEESKITNNAKFSKDLGNIHCSLHKIINKKKITILNNLQLKEMISDQTDYPPKINIFLQLLDNKYILLQIDSINNITEVLNSLICIKGNKNYLRIASIQIHDYVNKIFKDPLKSEINQKLIIFIQYPFKIFFEEIFKNINSLRIMHLNLNSIYFSPLINFPFSYSNKPIDRKTREKYNEELNNCKKESIKIKLIDSKNEIKVKNRSREKLPKCEKNKLSNLNCNFEASTSHFFSVIKYCDLITKSKIDFPKRDALNESDINENFSFIENNLDKTSLDNASKLFRSVKGINKSQNTSDKMLLNKSNLLSLETSFDNISIKPKNMLRSENLNKNDKIKNVSFENTLNLTSNDVLCQTKYFHNNLENQQIKIDLSQSSITDLFLSVKNERKEEFLKQISPIKENQNKKFFMDELMKLTKNIQNHYSKKHYTFDHNEKYSKFSFLNKQKGINIYKYNLKNQPVLCSLAENVSADGNKMNKVFLKIFNLFDKHGLGFINGKNIDLKSSINRNSKGD